MVVSSIIMMMMMWAGIVPKHANKSQVLIGVGFVPYCFNVTGSSSLFAEYTAEVSSTK